jgi:hypothetical protein
MTKHFPKLMKYLVVGWIVTWEFDFMEIRPWKS